MHTNKDIGIKICGMRDPENIMQVAALGPQYLGFIFYPYSPRFVGDDFTIPRSLGSAIKRVGVFVNESNGVIMAKAKTIGFEFVQLHGNESVAQAAELKSSGLSVIKVFSIDDDFNFDDIQPYKKIADYFLFDTKGKYYGGNAEAFNWDTLNAYDQETPFFLSGGLSPENISLLGNVWNMNIHAVDFNSGVEISPGLKSLEKIKTVMKKVAGHEPEAPNT